MRFFAVRKKVSNQYSYIPLHIMAQFCDKKGLPIKESDVIKTGYNFKTNWITDNVAVLNELKSYFVAYSFEEGYPLVYRNEENGVKYPVAYHESFFEKKQGTAKTKSYRLDDPVARKEALRNLRNHYLHWNSTYGQGDIDILVQTNYPNIEGGIRKRKID